MTYTFRRRDRHVGFMAASKVIWIRYCKIRIIKFLYSWFDGFYGNSQGMGRIKIIITFLVSNKILWPLTHCSALLKLTAAILDFGVISFQNDYTHILLPIFCVSSLYMTILFSSMIYLKILLFYCISISNKRQPSWIYESCHADIS